MSLQSVYVTVCVQDMVAYRGGGTFVRAPGGASGAQGPEEEDDDDGEDEDDDDDDDE